jgi:hypothetical protein
MPCPKLDLAGTFGTFIDGKVIMCNPDYRNTSCFSKSNSNDIWIYEGDMTTVRRETIPVHLSDTEWWLTGGFVNNEPSNKTEIYTVGVGFNPFVDLPEKRFRHNVIQINSTHFMVVGGECYEDAECRTSWVFDKTNQLWTLLPDSEIPLGWTYSGLVKLFCFKPKFFVTGSYLKL